MKNILSFMAGDIAANENYQNTSPLLFQGE